MTVPVCQCLPTSPRVKQGSGQTEEVRTGTICRLGVRWWLVNRHLGDYTTTALGEGSNGSHQSEGGDTTNERGQEDIRTCTGRSGV